MKRYLHNAYKQCSVWDILFGLTTLALFVYTMLHVPALGVLMAVGSPTVKATVRARADLAATREDTDFETGISLLDPNVNPATAAVMDVGKVTSRTIDFHWFEDELMPETDTINYGSNYDSSSTELIVDNYLRFTIGDLVRHELSGEVLLIHTIATNKITVIRDYGQSGEGWTALAGNIMDGDYLRIIGNAFEQGHELPGMRSTVEVDYKNYCQEIRTPFGISEIAAAAAHRGEQDWPFQRRKAGISHQRKLEYNFWWGKPYAGDKGLFSGTHGSGDLPTVAGGVDHFMREYAPSNQKKDETELTESEFQDFLEYVFEYGPDTRVCYCAPRLRTALDRWGISKLNTFSTDTMYGMAVATWLSSHGTVIFVTHKMFTRPQSTDYYYSFFLDLMEMKWITYSNIGSTRLRALDPYRATGATVFKEEYQTIACVKFGLAPHHSRLRFKTIG